MLQRLALVLARPYLLFATDRVNEPVERAETVGRDVLVAVLELVDDGLDLARRLGDDDAGAGRADALVAGREALLDRLGARDAAVKVDGWGRMSDPLGGGAVRRSLGVITSMCLETCSGTEYDSQPTWTAPVWACS
jgi:hypothetical protein